MEAFLPGLTQSQVKSGLRSYNPMEYTINIKGRLMDLSTPQVMGNTRLTTNPKSIIGTYFCKSTVKIVAFKMSLNIIAYLHKQKCDII